MLKYGLEIVISEWEGQGVLAPGERGTFAGTIPMHTKTTADTLTLTYLVEWQDKRETVTLVRGHPLMARCPQCERTIRKLLLTNDGLFRCTVCATGHKDNRRARAASLTELDKLQARALRLRKTLGDLTSSTDEIIWPEKRMPKKRWLKYLAELDVIEPRILELYQESLNALVDTVKPLP